MRCIAHKREPTSNSTATCVLEYDPRQHAGSLFLALLTVTISVIKEVVKGFCPNFVAKICDQSGVDIR
jgi:hypothetical protein